MPPQKPGEEDAIPTDDEINAAFAEIARLKRARSIANAVAFAATVVLSAAGAVIAYYFGYLALAGYAAILFLAVFLFKKPDNKGQ